MLKLFRRARKASPPPRCATIPAGRRCYAIGDIHGRADLLHTLLDRVRADSAGAGSVHVVFLGDFVDRGPESRQVIDRLVNGDWSWATPVFLRGNHEEAFHAALAGDLAMLARWTGFGGLATCESYGLGPAAWAEGQPERFRDRLVRLVPAEHRAFLDGLYDSFSMGDYLFVHAGIRPGVPLESQDPADLRWIREEFLDAAADHGKLVIHGHTVSDLPDVRGNRIGIDTGAYRTGRLTALVVEGGPEGRWRFLSTADADAGDAGEQGTVVAERKRD